jgi:xanthine dehydrogenase accessory factor
VFERLIVVRGGGDLGSGAALRLWRSGFSVVILEAPQPVAVRRTVSFAEAVYEGSVQVEELVAERVTGWDEVREVIDRGHLPLLVDPRAEAISHLQPFGVVDAILAKRNTGSSMEMAPLTVGLGPGFRAGVDVHAVVETNRGPHLGRVIWSGIAEPNTGEPGSISGHATSRVLRAPASGVLQTVREIGDVVEEGDLLASVGDARVAAGFKGLVRGLARNGLEVKAGMKIGDLDPRLDPSLCGLVSDKSLAVAGGVLEAVMMGQGPGAGNQELGAGSQTRDDNEAGQGWPARQ